MKKQLLPLILCLTMPLLAAINVRTTIRDVLEYGTHEEAGIITFSVNDDDLPTATPGNPVYMRIRLLNDTFLADTRVWSNAANAGNQTFDPIYIPMEFEELVLGDMIVAPPDAISIVRWVAGENEIWVCIRTPTSQWIENMGNPQNPAPNRRVRFTLGLTARQSWNQMNFRFLIGETNLPAASRTTTASSEADAVTTQHCIDLSQGNQPILPDPNSLIRVGLDFFQDMPASGATSVAEAASSADIVTATVVMPTVTGDDRIGRVYDAFTILTVPSPLFPDILDPGVGVINHSYDFPLRLGAPQPDIFADTIYRFNFQPALMQGFPVAVDGMNNPIDFNTIDPDVPPGTRVLVEGLAVANNMNFTQPSGPVSALFEITPGQWAIREAHIIYTGPTLSSPAEFDFQTDMLLTAGIGFGENRFLINVLSPIHDGPADVAPFDGGSDQWARCQPSLLRSVNETWTFGTVVRSVPTLGEWALIAFVTLLIGTALWFNRRRQGANFT